DISARVGKNGFNEVSIFSYDNPAFWITQDGVDVKSLAQPGPYFIRPGEAFCIDARFIAFHSILSPTTSGPPQLGRRFELFPYVFNPASPATAPAFPPGPHLTVFPPT